MNTRRASVAESTRSGTLLHLVTDGLTNSGLAVRPPEHAEGCQVAIACEGSECALTVDDWGRVTFEHRAWLPGAADPKLTADLATALLTGQPSPYPRLGRRYGQEGITFKAVVGLELRARGLDVALAVYEDEDFLHAHVEIAVTAPGTDNAARVCVTDDGCLTWTRDYWAEAAIAFEPGGLDGWIADPATVARSVAEAVTRAMSCLRPGLAGGAGNG